MLCVDAMEFVPPEDGPPVLERFAGPWHQEGYAYHHVLARVEAHDRSLTRDRDD